MIIFHLACELIFIDNIGQSVYRLTMKGVGRQGVIATSGWKTGSMLPVLRANECQQRHQSMLPKPLSPLEIIIEATGCSEATARRDLDVLEKSGQLIRTIGGAAIQDSGLKQIPSPEIPLADKRYFQLQGKEQIAKEAASLVKEGDIVCLTGGCGRRSSGCDRRRDAGEEL